MAKPSTGVVNVAFAELPVAGAVEVAQHKGFGLGEKLFCKAVGAFAAGKPAADDVEGALRRPETMEQPSQILIAYAVTP